VFDKEFVDAKIMVLPTGHDPDSFVCEHGAGRFSQLAESALGVIDFLLESAVKKHGLSVEGKVRIVNELAGPLAVVSDSVKRSLYAREISERLGIEEGALLEKVRQAGGRKPGRAPLNKTSPPEGSSQSRLERKIVAMMLQFPDILDEIDQRRVLDLIQDPVLKRIGRFVLERKSEPVRASEVIEAVEGSEHTVAALSMEDEPWDRKSGLKLISQLAKGASGYRKDPLVEEIRAAEKESDEASLERLLSEKYKQAVRREKEKMSLLKNGQQP
jgi:DNA primase